LLGGRNRIAQDLRQQHTRRSENVFPAYTDQRICRQRVLRRLFADVILGSNWSFVAHRGAPQCDVCRSFAAARLPISRHRRSATRAGFVSPSISSVQLSLSSTRPPPCGSAAARLARVRTRAPALTGAMKRTLSKP